MTKPDEIALLQKTIRAFGPDSYLGPWLDAHELELIRDITTDLAVDLPMPRDARRQAFDLIADANAEVAMLRSAAHADASKIVQEATTKAQTNADQIRARLRRDLERAAAAL